MSTKSAGKTDEALAKFEIILPTKQPERFAEATDVSKEEIPDRPKKSIMVAKYPRLEDIYERLQKQNSAMAQTEKKLGNLEMELQEYKGIFKGKMRKELLGEIEQTKKQLEQMKPGLTSIVTSYKYQNVKTFLMEYQKAKAEYTEYMQAVDNWEQKYGKRKEQQPKSILARLKQHEEQIKQKERNRTPVNKRDRGAR